MGLFLLKDLFGTLADNVRQNNFVDICWKVFYSIFIGMGSNCQR